MWPLLECCTLSPAKKYSLLLVSPVSRSHISCVTCKSSRVPLWVKWSVLLSSSPLSCPTVGYIFLLLLTSTDTLFLSFSLLTLQLLGRELYLFVCMSPFALAMQSFKLHCIHSYGFFVCVCVWFLRKQAVHQPSHTFLSSDAHYATRTCHRKQSHFPTNTPNYCHLIFLFLLLLLPLLLLSCFFVVSQPTRLHLIMCRERRRKACKM